MNEDAVEKEPEVDWKQSPFFLGEFYSKMDDGTAKCNSCPDDRRIKRKQSNTAGLDSHLLRKHPKIYEKFLKKKSEVAEKRLTIKVERDSKKRRSSVVVEDLYKNTQVKLQNRAGNLKLVFGHADASFQKEWDDGVVDFLCDTNLSFSAISGPPFRKIVDVLNRRLRYY